MSKSASAKHMAWHWKTKLHLQAKKMLNYINSMKQVKQNAKIYLGVCSKERTLMNFNKTILLNK